MIKFCEISLLTCLYVFLLDVLPFFLIDYLRKLEYFVFNESKYIIAVRAHILNDNCVLWMGLE